MGNSLNIRFVTLEEFNQLKGVDGRTSSQLCHGIKNQNLVAGKYWSADSVLKIAEEASEVDPSYTTNAVDCSAGLLIANGVKLHSHMQLYLNCHRNLESQFLLEKELTPQLERFFGHLDSLIRAGQFNGETINVDFVLGGGLVDGWDKNIDDFTPKMLENSPILRDKMIEMVQARLAQTEELAEQHGAKLDYSRSIFWGQKIIKPEDKSISYFTNMHYDPVTNTLSVNARKGHPNPDKLESPYGDPDGELTRVIDHISDATTQRELDEHYSQIELGISHISPQARSTLNFRNILAAFDKLTAQAKESNSEKYDGEILWQNRLNRPSYPYEMNYRYQNNRLCTGIGNGEVYCAIQIDGGEFIGYAMNSSGDVRSLGAEEMPQFTPPGQSRNGSYFYAESQRRFSDSSEKGSADEAEVLKELAGAIKDPESHVAFYTGAGISVASGIGDFSGYYRDVWGDSTQPKSIEDFQKVLSLLEREPNKVLGSIMNFFKSFEMAEPSVAHEALAELALLADKALPVFTENHDSIHQKTGLPVIATPRLRVEDLKAGLDLDYIKQLDYLVCSGLSHDDRALITYLREINPNLKIVANSLPGQVPDFIDPNNERDIYLAGDVQEIIPKLLETVKTLGE